MVLRVLSHAGGRNGRRRRVTVATLAQALVSGGAGILLGLAAPTSKEDLTREMFPKD
jgi:hypothetical protein